MLAPERSPHPIVAQMAPSDEQYPAVLARDCDIVTTAGAGTGKTRTLVARYLSLLADGLALRRIVAITFTKKAAREMRNRIRAEVRRYLEEPQLDRQERIRWQQIYSELDAARIGTIHSLCTEILRTHPAEARIDPRFEVLDEGQTMLLQTQAVDRALAWAADDREASSLFSLLGEYLLRPVIARLLQERLAVKACIQSDQDPMARWKRILTGRQEERLRMLLADPDWGKAVSTLEAEQAHKLDDRMEIQRQSALAAIGRHGGSLAERLDSLASLGQINLVGGSQTAWPGGKAQLERVKEALREVRRLWRENAGLLELRLNPLDRALAQAIPALEASWGVACQVYATLKRERNVLDFDDLEQEAQALLRSDTGAREHWENEIGAILVDEFQDTNGRQRDLVQLLNGDRGRLFIVGDAKQSIYRFRGADVTVFRQEREQIATGGGHAYSLLRSYRAHRALIQGLNDLLRPVLGEAQEPARPWVEPFTPLAPHRDAAHPGLEAPFIELHLTVGNKGAGALDRAADAIVGRIVELVEGCSLPDAGARPLDYGDVAILCRASNSFQPYEDALERAGVPYLTVAGRGFYGRPEIRDLLNALQAVADPTDDLALVGLLRSPAFALSDATLFHLGDRWRETGRSGSLWSLLQAEAPDPAKDHHHKVERAVAIISDLNHQAGKSTVAELLDAFLRATDYRAALIQAGEVRGARNVGKLLSDAHASNLVGVGEFLDYVSGLRDSGTREGEARATSEGAVQIMSVHAAKGLEFAVVAIGDITRKRPSRTNLLIDSDLGVLLPLKEEGVMPAVYRLGKAWDDDQDAAESDRLLYVAATRAQQILLLSGCISLSKDGKPGQLGDWLGRLGARGVLGLTEERIEHDEEGSSAIRLDLQAGDTPVACTIYEPRHAWGRQARQIEPEQAFSVPLPPPLLAPITARNEAVDDRTIERERTPPLRVWRVVPRDQRSAAPARVIGLLVHEALAAWRFPNGDLDTWAQARARGHGITDPHQLADASRQTRELLQRFQSHSLFREMAAAEQRLHEVPYSLEVGGETERGIIDAIYQHRGEWIIIEFKTDHVRNWGHFQELLGKKDYLAQARQYARAAERLLGQRPQVKLCMLNYGGRVHLHQVG